MTRTHRPTTALRRVSVFSFAAAALLLAGCNCGPVPPATSDGGADGGTATKFAIGGTLSGLVGTGLVLQLNGAETLALNGNGVFAFPTALASGTAYTVTVMTQPSSPTQACSVTNGSGTVGTAAVTNVFVDCASTTFTVGGTISGLLGTSLVLENNGGDPLAVTADGSFTFKTPLATGATYDVTVLTQPATPDQICLVTGGTGTVGTANVTSVAITCITTYAVGGTVSGLRGTLVLQNNGADDLTITTDGTFTFPTQVPVGGPYAVTVLTQPAVPSQTCVVANATGTIGTAAVTNVAVTCTTNSFTIGGTVSGLASGESVVLQNNAGDDLTVSADGAFTFATAIESGLTYDVTVLTNPASPIAQTCLATSASGTVGGANVTDVTVICTTNTYLVGGTVTGLAGTGLVLQDNAGDDLPVSADGTFVFATRVASGATYDVSVLTQPTVPWQTCIVASGTGTVADMDITNVTVTCTNNAYTISGTTSGLAGTGMVLQVNGTNNLTVNANGTFTFGTPVASGTMYDVTVLTPPSSPTQTCVVAGGSGTMAGADVTGVTVTCTTNSYTIGGIVSGLQGTGMVLQNNAGDDLPITANGAFTFSTSVLSGNPFAVTILTQPTGPAQACTVAAGAGTVGGANVTSVRVACDRTWSASLFPQTVSGSSYSLGDMCFDGNGDLLFTANAQRTIVRVDRVTGVQTTLATGFPGTYLFGVVYNDSNGLIYTLASTGQIHTVTSTGVSTLLATYSGSSPSAIALAPSTFGAYAGYIIGVTNGGTVFAMHPTTGAFTTITTAAGAMSDLAFAPNGTLYVVGGTSVRTVTSTGVVATFATGLSSADGITFSPDGSKMFVADSGPDLVYQLTVPGAVRTTIGSYDIDNGWGVGGIIADPGNTVIVMTGETSLTLRAFTY